jgi:hypothetical protein
LKLALLFALDLVENCLNGFDWCDTVDALRDVTSVSDFKVLPR